METIPAFNSRVLVIDDEVSVCDSFVQALSPRQQRNEALAAAALEAPTQVDRQGPDVGSQYRSVVFTHDADQAAAAETAKQQLASAGAPDRPIATAIEPAGDYWLAEDYHQQYDEKRRKRFFG